MLISFKQIKPKQFHYYLDKKANKILNNKRTLVDFLVKLSLCLRNYKYNDNMQWY